MNDLTKDLGKSLLTLLWYLSNYPDSDDYSETTRRDFFEGVIKVLHPYTKKQQDSIKEIFYELERSFKGHPYEERVSLFVTDLYDAISENQDPASLFIKGHELKNDIVFPWEKED